MGRRVGLDRECKINISFGATVIGDVNTYFALLSGVLAKLPREKVDNLSDILFQAYERSKTTFVFGNGGSASLASHFACDLGKGTSLPASIRKRFRSIALTDNLPTMTAWANDSSYDDIFSEQLENLVVPGDVAFAISCSGNSSNILKALRIAKDRGATTLGLTGFQGGKMKGLCDSCLIVPSDNMQIIEDVHLSVAHCIFSVLKVRIEQVVLQRAAAAPGRS